MGRRSRLITLIAAALLGGLLPAPSAQASQAMCGSSSGMIATTLYTFKVDAKPQKDHYQLGSTVKVDFTVTRPGEEDPIGEGQPLDSPASAPASDVEINVSLYLGNFYWYGSGRTDENGKGTVSVKTDAKASPGMVRAAVSARTYYNRGGCPDFEEFGSKEYQKFYKATR